MAEKVPQMSAAEAEAAEKLRVEMSNISGAQRAAVLMLLLGEQQASEIVKFLNPTEVQSLGGAMVDVSDVSQEAVNAILDEFVATIKKQSSLGLGSTDYVEKVFNLEQILTKKDMLIIVMKTLPNDTIMNYLKQVWEEQGVFIVIHGLPKLRFNLLEHSFVPPHIVLSEKETTDVMTKYNIMDHSQIPSISRFDPVAMAIGLRPGQMCKIIRTSKTAIQIDYYRICSQ